MNTNHLSCLLGIGTSVPENQYQQSEIADFMIEALQLKGEKEKELRVLYRATGIQQRHSVLPDFSGRYSEKRLFHTEKNFPQVGGRMALYRKEALPLAKKAVMNCLAGMKEAISLQEITHLVTVSCTGMYAPGLDIDLIKSLGLKSSVQRYCINFMGCYAAVQGMKLADSIARSDSSARVLVVCVELCTIHFRNSIAADDLLAASLFADGAAAVIIGQNEKEALASLEGFQSDLLFNGAEEMAWQIGDDAFQMKLSTYVPEVIGKGLPGFLSEELRNTIQKASFFAIHPGGRKILKEVEKQFELQEGDLEVSHQVLSQYGNMSSPTILFVLEKILSEENSKAGKDVFGMAFGPGLALESFQLRLA